MERALCWIRRDLRLADHASLAQATNQAKAVAVVFVFDRQILDVLVDQDDRRLTFIHQSLQEADRHLRERGSRLIVLHGDPTTEIPQLAAQLKAEAVFAARDYEPYAAVRDEAVGQHVNLRLVKDAVIFEAGEVLNQSGQPFRVYSPYARAWRAKFNVQRDAAIHRPNPDHLMGAAAMGDAPELLPLEKYGFVPTDLWLEAGERAGHARLKAFRRQIDGYGEDRNFPAKESTSGLSVHLRFGTVSVRECVRSALEIGSAGADKWLGEVIWRDFYQDVLAHHPHVVDLPFQAQYGNLIYPGDDRHFEAWADGQTGYPLVDAAMRCLNQTGFMHNRLRMVVASFLTKDLLVDYRKGEAYFARRLLDFDLASNNGGWQWAASTGADPQPYFRIFNPVTQSEKFDPDGEFIRRYVPEISALHGPSIHFPAAASTMELTAAGIELGKTYPLPIVDHKVQRERAIQLLAAAKNSRASD